MAKRQTSRVKTKPPGHTPKSRTSAEITATLAALDRLEPATPKVARVVALLKKWLSDESGYDEETWPQLKKALNQERRRVGARRLFNG